MPLFRPQTTRRREIRKTLPKPQAAWRRLIVHPPVLWAALFAALYVAFASWITLDSLDDPAYRPGQVVDRAVVSRVPFEAVNIKATSQARERARAEVPAIYVPNAPFLEATERSLATLPAVAAAALSLDKVAQDIRERFGLTEATLEALRTYQTDGQVSSEWETAVDEFMNLLRRRPMVPTERFQIEKQNLTLLVALRQSDDGLAYVREGELVNLADEQQIRKAVEELATTANIPPTARPLLARYFVALREPTFQYDQQATETARNLAIERVEPLQTVYEPDQVMVPAGVVLDEDNYRLLQKENLAYEASLEGSHWFVYRLGPLFEVLLIGIALAASVSYLRPRVGQNPMRGLALTALLVLTIGLAWVVRPLGPHTDPVSIIAPAILAAVILTIAYDALFASVVVVLHAIAMSIALDIELAPYLVTVTGVILSAVQVREIRQRGTLIRAGFITGLVMFVGVVAAEITERQIVEGIYRQIFGAAALAGFGTLAVGFFVLGILPSIEKAFRVTTAMTLLELCDVNQPLLRRLAQSAPGTYNHSLVIGTLAENAAEAIGANGLLARVGAYYHDIGKINKPQYFVENRVGSINLHDKLSPAMSLLIIVGHVKDGIELAREYGLPPALHHFIESHHGTTLVEYFYHEARKGKAEEEQPEEFEYRYPGPKPHTKEAAILMICDAVESASRTMAEPTATRIEQLVHKLAMKRLMDGQFDECDITLGQLHVVEQSLTRTLAGIYHGRIAYPAASREPERPASPQPAAQPAGKADERAVG